MSTSGSTSSGSTATTSSSSSSSSGSSGSCASPIDLTLAGDLPPGNCSDAGLCQVSGVYQSGSTLNYRGVFALSDSDVYAVGDVGTIEHWDGQHWTLVLGGSATTTSEWNAVWGSSASDVWVAGAGDGVSPNFAHWDGKTWTGYLVGVPSGGALTIQAMIGFAPNDIWAGGGNSIVHFDGCNWNFDANTSPTIQGLWGVSANDLWAVGNPVLYHHTTAGGWAKVTSPDPGANLYGVYGFSTNDVWAVGSHAAADLGSLLHWDGTKWNLVASPPYPPTGSMYLRAVWGAASNNIWAAGSGDQGQLLAGLGLVDLLHYDGTSWTQVINPYSERASYREFYGLTGTSTGTVWGVGTLWSVFQASDAGVWSEPSGTTASTMPAVWGSGPNDVYGLAPFTGHGTEILHWNGVAWSPVFDAMEPSFNGIGGASGTVWAVGSAQSFDADAGGYGFLPSDTVTAVYRYYDGGWTNEGARLGEYDPSGNLHPVVLSGVWAAATDDVWAVGSCSKIFHDEGSGWHDALAEGPQIADCGDGGIALSNGALNAVWGSPTNHVYAVGGYWADSLGHAHFGILEHAGPGSNWTTYPDPTGMFIPAQLNSISGSSDTNIWMVGSDGQISGAPVPTILNIGAGGALTQVIPPTLSAFEFGVLSVYVAGQNDVWFGAGSTSLVHFDGTNWTEVVYPPLTALNQMFGLWASGPTGTGELWAVGASGVIFHSPGLP